MLCQRFTYPSTDGIHAISAVCYLPEESPRAVVQIVHGLAEHVERYEPFAAFLTAHGFAVCGENHLGHGHETPTEERGFFAEDDAWMTVAKDTAALSDTLQKRFPGLPFVMFGHSMGSFLARTVFLAGLVKLDGLILCGTGNQGHLTIALAKRIARHEIKKHGARAESPRMEKLVFGSYLRRVKHPTGKNDWISSLPEEVRRYESDPDCGFTLKLGMYLALFEGIGYVTDPKNIKKADPAVPVFFIAGQDDPVGSYGKGVRAAYRAMQKAGLRTVAMKLYPGRHEILNDVAADAVRADILAFLETDLALGQKAPRAAG